METTVRFLDGVKFEVETRGHKVICDQPRNNGGEDAGMAPPEFLLASLGTCAGFYAAQYLKTRSLPMEGLEVKVLAEKKTQPARLGSFRIDIKTLVDDPRHREGLMRAVKTCLVHNTLMHAPEIEIRLETPLAHTC
jgi:uncharacterized OsmC-like protein